MLEREVIEKLKEFLGGHIPPPPVLGKVVKVYERGGKAHFLNCLYSADVLLLELSEDTGAFKETDIVIPDVPILTLGVGDSEGIFFLPETGSIVKVSFLYGSYAFPIVDGALPYGKEILEHPAHHLVLKAQKVRGTAATTEWNSQTTHNGDMVINGDLYVSGNIVAGKDIADWDGAKGTLATLRATYNSHTHPGDSGGTTGAPNQTVGD
jgi:hypothetical protein